MLHAQLAPAVAWNGTNFLVVWTEDGGTRRSNIYGARVDASGTVLDPAGIRISTAANDQTLPQVASDGTDFIVVWQDRRNSPNANVWGTRVSSVGAANTSGFPISSEDRDQAAPAVAWNGSSYLVVWEDARNGGKDIFGSRFGASGDPFGNGVAISTAAGDQLAPTVATHGSDFVVAWQDTRNGGNDIYGNRVPGAGGIVDAPGVPISTEPGDQLSPTVASNGTTALIAWQDLRNGEDDIYGARATTPGGTLDVEGGSEIAISTAPNPQRTPAVAFNGSFLVVWQDEQSGTPEIRARRVSSDGSFPDPDPDFVIGGPPAATSPAVVRGPGGDWGVVYERVAAEVPYNGQTHIFVRTVAPK